MPQRHLRAAEAGEFEGTQGIPGGPVSPNAGRGRELTDAYVHPQPAFDHKAHRPPSSIQDPVDTHAGVVFARRLRWGVRGDPGNPRRSSFTKCSRGRELTDAYVHPQVAFGPKVHRPAPSSIQGRDATPSACAFARRGRRGVRGDQGNLRRCSLTKMRLWVGAEHIRQTTDTPKFINIYYQKNSFKFSVDPPKASLSRS